MFFGARDVRPAGNARLAGRGRKCTFFGVYLRTSTRWTRMVTGAGSCRPVHVSFRVTATVLR